MSALIRFIVMTAGYICLGQYAYRMWERNHTDGVLFFVSILGLMAGQMCGDDVRDIVRRMK